MGCFKNAALSLKHTEWSNTLGFSYSSLLVTLLQLLSKECGVCHPAMLKNLTFRCHNVLRDEAGAASGLIVKYFPDSDKKKTPFNQYSPLFLNALN